MANILFFCNYQVAQPACGGIVRVTGTLADIFSSHGHKCHLCYYFDNAGKPIESFCDRLVLQQHHEESVLATYLEEKNIDYIFLQTPLDNTNWYLLPMLRRLADNMSGHCTLIHCYHSIPFAECKGFDRQYFKYLLKQKDAILPKTKKLLWASLCMLFPKLAVKKTSPRYSRICTYCDLMVLLSKRYIPFFISHVRCRDEQIQGIPNPLTFSSTLSIDQIDAKTKTVIIVGRLDESTKRLSKAIRIWSIIENRYNVKDWSLIIVGDGPDMEYYKRLANVFKTKNITFAGRQYPVEYYRKASILISTSAIEGLPMVILEAKQMGCIPVVFDSYDTASELIADSYNGFVVKNNDYESFAAKLYFLITHQEVRTEMIKHCLESNDDFLPETIYKEWEKIIR